MSKELFHAILNKEFYFENKELLNEELFNDDSVIRDLFKLVKNCYEVDNTNSLTSQDLIALYKVKYPAETETKKQLVYKFLGDFEGADVIQPAIAKAILKSARLNSLHTYAAQILAGINGEPNIEKVKQILLEAERLTNEESNSDVVDLDIDYLLQRTKQNCKWTFNIPALAAMCTGIGPSTFSIFGGRVNSGKSLAALSLCFSPGGFADQGAKILYICNEEDGAYPGLRAVSSYTGKTFEEIEASKAETAKVFAKIRPNVHVIDNAHISMNTAHKLADKYKPDIIVMDMLDHIQINGEHAREDLRLGQIYRQAREVAKMHRLAVIGTSQASADADGKLIYGFDCLVGSKTDKAAAADLIALLGMNPPNDAGEYSPQRAMNIAKNKITGKHGAVYCVIVPERSRLIP